MIKLILMNKEKFDWFSTHSKAERKKDLMVKRRYSDEDAEVQSMKDFDAILSDGLKTKDNFLYSIIDSQDHDLGYLWYSIRKEGSQQKAFICHLFISEEFRGNGFGKITLNLFEQQVRDLNISLIGLHVWASNKVARGLYESCGYKEKSILMDKVLS